MMIDVADGNTIYYYHFDGLGSVVALSDINNVVVESYSYDVFGEPNISSSVGNPYLSTGRRYDPEAGSWDEISFDIERVLEEIRNNRLSKKGCKK